MRVNVNKLSFAYTQKLILKDLTFSLKSGDFLTILGKNGTGKSTFIKCLIKNVAIPNDMIYLDDIDINQIKRFNNISYVPQKSDFNLEFPITVNELLSCSYKGSNKSEYYTYVINQLELNKFYHEDINNLSGGQLQRVFIARGLLNNPKLLVLDEPTVGVDIENIKSIHKVLKELKEKGVTIILITHNTDWINDLTDYTLLLDESMNYTFKKVEN